MCKILPKLSDPPIVEAVLLILEIGVMHREDNEVDNWDWIAGRIQSLRNLKNRIFKGTLTDVCLRLFQEPTERL